MDTKLRQWEAVYAILSEVKKDPAIKAAFVKGAMAYGQVDEFSDVDFYCLVHEDEMDHFLDRRIELLEQYQEIVFYSESNFVGPQIVAVFVNGLHFDLYTVTESSFPVKGEFLSLYDPEEVLPKYQSQIQDLELTPEGLETMYHEFAFCLIEFEAAIGRKQMLFAGRLVSYLSSYAAVLVRQLYDKKRASIGSKKLELYLPENLKNRFYSTLDIRSPKEAHQSVLELIDIVEEAAHQLEVEYQLALNWRFLEMMKQRLTEMEII